MTGLFTDFKQALVQTNYTVVDGEDRETEESEKTELVKEDLPWSSYCFVSCSRKCSFKLRLNVVCVYR